MHNILRKLFFWLFSMFFKVQRGGLELLLVVFGRCSIAVNAALLDV
jgi:hypothetical protein